MRILALMAILIAQIGLAAEVSPPSSELPLSPTAQRIERSREWLANRVEKWSGDLDSFFIERFFNEHVLDDDVNGSRAVVSLHSRRVMGESVDIKLDARLKLELPHTQKRLKLLISSEDDSEYDVERDPLRSIEKATYSTALRVVLSEARTWHTDADVGLRLKMPFNPFVRMRAYRYLDFLSWNARFSQSLFYYHIDGWVEKTSYFMDHKFAEDKLLRIYTDADYYLQGRYFELDYGIELYQTLKNNAALVYRAGATGNTEIAPTFRNYFVGLKYRRRVYQDWVYGEVSPQLEWNEDRNYQRIGVIMFRLEALIGPED